MNELVKTIPGIRHSGNDNFLLIAGPCVVEDEKTVFETAEHIVKGKQIER